MGYKKYLLLFIFFLGFYQYSFSHPHVFFDVNAKIETQEKHLEGIEVSLLLDDMNTLLNQKIFKAAKDGEVQEKNIVFLKYLYSHIRVFWKGKRIPKEKILFELAKVEDEQLRIDFFISIDDTIKSNDVLTISFYDTDYYYTYDYDLPSFQLQGIGKDKWKARLFTEKGISFYFKSIHPVIYEVVFL